MSQLTVTHASTNDGFNFLRSDGKRFFMVFHEDGHASLYAGKDKDSPPQVGIVDFDISITDKLERARQFILAYPDRPK